MRSIWRKDVEIVVPDEPTPSAAPPDPPPWPAAIPVPRAVVTPARPAEPHARADERDAPPDSGPARFSPGDILPAHLLIRPAGTPRIATVRPAPDRAQVMPAPDAPASGSAGQHDDPEYAISLLADGAAG